MSLEIDIQTLELVARSDDCFSDSDVELLFLDCFMIRCKEDMFEAIKVLKKFRPEVIEKVKARIGVL